MIYVIIYIILLFGCVFYDVFGKKYFKTGWYIIECLALVLVAGLRYKVGGDTLSYHDEFDLMPSLGNLSDYDFSSGRYNVFWVILTALCKSVVNDFAFFQVVHAIIVNTAFFHFFRKHARWYFTAALFYGLLYFFTYNTELLRAAISVSIFLWSYDFLIKKKWIPYLLCFIAAYGFHSESIMMLILPAIHLLTKLKVDRNYMIGLVAVAFVFTLFVNFTSLFGKLSFVSEKMSDSLSFYLDSDRAGDISILGYCKFFVFQLPWLYFLWVSPNKYMKALLTIYYFFIFQSLHYSNIIQRELDFIYPFLIISIADACEFAKSAAKSAKGNLKIFYQAGTIASVALILFQQALYFITDDRWLLFLPYSSIFDPVENPIREELFFLLQHQY